MVFVYLKPARNVLNNVYFFGGGRGINVSMYLLALLTYWPTLRGLTGRGVSQLVSQTRKTATYTTPVTVY
jgi:hypothetical protein